MSYQIAKTLRENHPILYNLVHMPEFSGGFLVRESPPGASTKPRLLDHVRQAIRTRHYSRSTEKTYIGWIKRFIFFHGKRHPAEMGEPEITQFLFHLATHDKVSASTQNQALSALLFLYKEVLQTNLDWFDGLVRANTYWKRDTTSVLFKNSLDTAM